MFFCATKNPPNARKENECCAKRSTSIVTVSVSLSFWAATGGSSPACPDVGQALDRIQRAVQSSWGSLPACPDVGQALDRIQRAVQSSWADDRVLWAVSSSWAAVHGAKWAVSSSWTVVHGAKWAVISSWVAVYGAK
ncbi:uncharacterized protein A4U43_C05F4120 [Asparagus officinalis]|uniref:Uncharacterized protein n=1 Tax=Asparagus officinalis TaxID=4686 RepID=A0A5P1ESX4_ASPOF|nr:uncharacterized protein A4U43_C05F4120 [Asparagus officinalis]